MTTKTKPISIDRWIENNASELVLAYWETNDKHEAINQIKGDTLDYSEVNEILENATGDEEQRAFNEHKNGDYNTLHSLKRAMAYDIQYAQSLEELSDELKELADDAWEYMMIIDSRIEGLQKFKEQLVDDISEREEWEENFPHLVEKPAYKLEELQDRETKTENTIDLLEMLSCELMDFNRNHENG